jgi:outer membrane protein assembly factor BamA
MKGEPAAGRPSPEPVAKDLLAVPRIVLAPPRLLWKAIQYPVEAAANLEEKYHLTQKLYYMFTSWDGSWGVRPQFTWTLSFSPFFGLMFFHNRMLGRGTTFDVTVESGFSPDLVQARAHARPTPWGLATQLDLTTSYVRRDDQLFTGIGMDASKKLGPSRYLLNAFDVGALLRFIVRPEARLFVGGHFGLRRYADGRQLGSEPPVSKVFCVRTASGLCSQFTDENQVPGFHNGTEFLRVNAGFSVDTRDVSFKPTSGAVVDFSADYSHGMRDDSSYFRFRGSVMGVLDLWKRSHILVIRAWAMTVVPTNNAPVPFTELVVLGGWDDLRGVRWGRFRDFSGVLFTAEYRWPVWMWMDAVLFADAGGVSGKGWSGFQINELVPDVGVGLRIRTSRSFYFRIQTAWSPLEGVQFFFSANAVP